MKYRRKSIKGKNIFILSRFHGRISSPFSKGEDKSKRKELDENEETLFTEPRKILFTRALFTRVLFTRENTVHRYCSPKDSSAWRTLPLGAPFDPSITYTQDYYFPKLRNPKHLKLLIHLLTNGENFLNGRRSKLQMCACQMGDEGYNFCQCREGHKV
jgi:hypothetical protein